MWEKPNVNTAKFQFVLSEIRNLGLKIYAARTEYESIIRGGDYSIVCPFSNNQLFASDDLEEVARFFKIGGDHG